MPDRWQLPESHSLSGLSNGVHTRSADSDSADLGDGAAQQANSSYILRDKVGLLFNYVVAITLVIGRRQLALEMKNYSRYSSQL